MCTSHHAPKVLATVENTKMCAESASLDMMARPQASSGVHRTLHTSVSNPENHTHKQANAHTRTPTCTHHTSKAQPHERTRVLRSRTRASVIRPTRPAIPNISKGTHAALHQWNERRVRIARAKGVLRGDSWQGDHVGESRGREGAVRKLWLPLPNPERLLEARRLYVWEVALQHGQLSSAQLHGDQRP